MHFIASQYVILQHIAQYDSIKDVISFTIFISLCIVPQDASRNPHESCQKGPNILKFVGFDLLIRFIYSLRIYLLLMDLTIDSTDKKYDNQFENVEEQTFTEIVSTREPLNNYVHNYHTLQNLEADEEAQNRLDLLEGNPILPPGKYHLRQQPQFRLKYLSMREKFNKTSLQNKGKSLRNLKQQLSAKNDETKQRQESNEDSQDYEFLCLLQTRKLVYRRINNSKINVIGKERILCSVFFEWKREKLCPKQEPIFQHLTRNKNLQCKTAQADWLCFSSSFESGNLLMVLKNPIAAMPTYELYMQNDVNTKGCTQWYYFSITSKSRGKAKLRIMNFYKPTSLYQKGMKVLFSYDAIEWKRTGTSITYSKSDKYSYSLDFIHDFQIPEKETYFSYGYPYTYGENLSSYLNCITSQLKFQKIVHKSTICISAMGNPIHILYISNFSQKKEPKQLIYIIGRQHPGETPASYIVEGVISFLLSNSNQAKQLRERYEFRVIPMVNVDGVINGNYRSNISGMDINRQWQFPSKKGQPEVFWLKQQIGNNRKQTIFFLDIHAHSRKMNSFFYGSRAFNKQNKLYPFICSKLNKFISYTQSAFTDDPSKKTTARMILETQFSIPHSLTFQVSFYGWTDPVKQTNYSFKQSDLKLIGESLGIGFYYSMIGIQKAKEVKNSVLPKCHSEKQKTLIKNSIKLLEKWNKQLEKEINEDVEDVYSEGSSLNPEHFELKDEEKLMIAQMQKKSQQVKEKDQFRNLSTPKVSKGNSRKKMLIYSTLQPSDIVQESKLLAPKGEVLQKNLGISSNEFYHFSSTTKGKKKQPFSVRQLQLQLQLGGEPSPQRKLRGLRLRMGHQNQILSGFERYQSLDMDRQKNYKNDVLQMKKAFKYLLQSKSSDYQQYKSCFKAFNNELIGLQRHQRYHNK